MGGCNVVPGMSGGTVIILLGIYEAMIGSVNGLFKSKKQFKDGLIYLAPIAIGMAVGIFALSKLVSFLIADFALPTFALFAGLIAGSVPFIYKSAQNQGSGISDQGKDLSIEYEVQSTDCGNINNDSNPSSLIPNPSINIALRLLPAVLACALVVVLALFAPPDSGVKELNFFNGIMLAVSGAVAMSAMVIPGISGAYMLILLGYYSTVINAVSAFNIFVLLIFILGAVVGFLLTAKGIGFVLKRFRVISYHAIVGFLIGSVAGIFIYEGTYASATNTLGIISAVIFFIAGTACTVVLSLLKPAKKQPKTYENEETSEGK